MCMFVYLKMTHRQIGFVSTYSLRSIAICYKWTLCIATKGNVGMHSGLRCVSRSKLFSAGQPAVFKYGLGGIVLDNA